MADKATDKASSSVVKLNVGGRRFMTTHGTLECVEGTFFTGLLSGKFAVSTDEKGYIFIDRSPSYFEPVLDFLRSGKWECPPHLQETTLQEEGRYYGILQDGESTPKKKGVGALAKLQNPRQGFSDENICDAIRELQEELVSKQQELVARKRQKEEEEKLRFISQHRAELTQIKEHVFTILAALVQQFPHHSSFYVAFLPSLTQIFQHLQVQGFPLPPVSYSPYSPKSDHLPMDAQVVYDSHLSQLLMTSPSGVQAVLEELSKAHSLTIQRDVFHLFLYEYLSNQQFIWTSSRIYDDKHYSKELAGIWGCIFFWEKKAL